MDLKKKKKTYFYFMDLESLSLEIHNIKIQHLWRAQQDRKSVV